MITLSDYQTPDQVVFGQETSMQDLENLNKAISALEITGRETADLTTASGAPLKVESLEKTLKTITYGEQNAVFWKNIPRSPAYNTVEEYNQLVSYGQDRGGFNAEGELPVEEDSTYVRRAQLVKFLGVVKSVTHPMSLVSTQAGVGNIIQREIKNGTLWILRKLDRGLYDGNATVIPEEFNGILTQHELNDAFTSRNDYFNSSTVQDLRGLPLDEKHIESGAESIVENFGLGDDFYAPPKVLSDFVKNFYGNKFIQPNTAALTDGIMGQRVKSFESQFGNIALNWDVFLNPPPTKTSTSVSTSDNAPAAPSVPTAAAVASDPNSKWATTDAGDYFYAVTAINRYGESSLSITTAATAIVTGGAIDLAFTAGGGTNAATGYRIYRSNEGAASAAVATFSPLFVISISQLAAGYDGAAGAHVRDLNRYMPNCYQAMLVQRNDEVIEFKQLAPLMKMDLAIVSPAYRFMVLLYGTPFLYAPMKITRFINIGKATS